MQNSIISDLTLQNFKCHQELHMEFSPLTILSGGNAVGKSSVIQSILMLAKCYQNSDNAIMSTNDIYGMNLGIPSTIISSNHSSDKVTISSMVKGVQTSGVLKLNNAAEESLSFKIDNWDSIVCDETWDDVSLFYLNAERNGPRISSEIYESLGLYVGSHGENTNYIISKMDLLEKTNSVYRIAKEVNIADISRFSANCEAWLDMIIPGTQIKTSVNHELNVSVVKIRNGSDFYMPTATGFGISYILPVITQALVATTVKSAVLIVENPEAHLHPYGQSMIAKFLALIASCGVQVILETHSEHIINGCRLQLAKENITDIMKILFFEKNSKPSEINIMPNGEVERWPKGFFDQSKRDLRELLELRRCSK